MQLGKLVKKLKRFDRIAVVGPQRSGTNIATIMLAEELGYEAYPECKMGKTPSIYVEFFLLGLQPRVVVNAASIGERCHRFPESVAVVCMQRPVSGIWRSEDRIEWDHAEREEHKHRIMDTAIGARYCNGGMTLAEMRYVCWNKQKQLIRNPFELEYESLKEHPLWVPQPERTGFTMLQTKPEEAQA